MAANAEKEILQNSHTTEELEGYLRAKAKKHTYYKIYGTEDKLRSIYEKKKLYLSCGKDWNDPKDREQLLRSERYSYYVRCFSFSKSENVAMWMLYGGMGDQGVLVQFSQKFLNELTEKITHVSLGYFSGDNFEGKVHLQKDEFELYLIDMLYVRDDINSKTEVHTYHIKRHEEGGDIATREVVDSLRLCRKHYEWNYENECRLVLKVKKRIDTNRYTDAEIDFSEIDKNIAPSTKNVIMTPKYHEDPPHDYIKRALSDGLNWDLCLDCLVKKKEQDPT